MPTKHFCDHCGIEVKCQWWQFGGFDMLCYACYRYLKGTA